MKYTQSNRTINHEPHLKKFLSLIAKDTENDESNSSPKRVFSGRIPDKFLTEEMKKDESPSLILTDDEALLFDERYKNLRKDCQTEYLKDNEVKNLLWYLTCEIWSDRKKFKNSKELQSKINNFVEDICKPLEEYEVIFKVNNLKIKKRTRVWDSVIINYTKRTLMQKGFKHSEKLLSKQIDDFEKQTLLLITETGTNSSLVVDRARQKGNEIVKLLQTYLSEMSSVVNEQLLFSLSENYLLRKKDESKMIGPGWQRNFSPIEFDYEEQFKMLTQKANKHYDLLKNVPEKIQNCVKRTIVWIGKAVSEEDFDLKIAFLCTALETLLTTKQDGRKGEKIAYRIALLKKHFEEYITHPRHILWLYQLRSSVVHGSNIRVASKSEYHTLLRLTREMLDYFIQFVNQHSLKKQTQVLEFLIKSQYAEDLLNWLKLFPDKNSTEIVKSLEDEIFGNEVVPVCLLLKKE